MHLSLVFFPVTSPAWWKFPALNGPPVPNRGTVQFNYSTLLTRVYDSTFNLYLAISKHSKPGLE